MRVRTDSRTRSVKCLRDVDSDPPVVAVDDEVPMVVVGHFEDDGNDVVEAAVVLVVAAVEVSLVLVDIHETDSGGRAAQLHLEAGAACASAEVPVEVFHTLLVAVRVTGRKWLPTEPATMGP